MLPSLAGGGVERIATRLGAWFQDRGYIVEYVLCASEGEFLIEVPTGATVVDLGANRIREAFWPLVKYFRLSKPDAVIASLWPLSATATLALRMSGHRARLMLREDNNLSRQYRDRGRLHHFSLKLSQMLCTRLADIRVGVSSGVAGDLADLSRLPESCFEVIPNPVPIISPDARESEVIWHGMPHPRFLSVGSFKAQKNHALLIEAFAAVHGKVGGSLMLLGEGPLRPQLEAQVAEVGLNQSISMPGFRSDTQNAYSGADVFVLSSDHEGFGIVLVEALQAGLAVISTDCPSGPAEILEDGKFGWLTPVGDPAELARAMEEAASADVDRESNQRRAADFSPDLIVELYLALLFPEKSLNDREVSAY